MRELFEVRYMCDKEGELLGIYEKLEYAEACVREVGAEMHIERAADLRIRRLKVVDLA